MYDNRNNVQGPAISSTPHTPTAREIAAVLPKDFKIDPRRPDILGYSLAICLDTSTPEDIAAVSNAFCDRITTPSKSRKFQKDLGKALAGMRELGFLDRIEIYVKVNPGETYNDVFVFFPKLAIMSIPQAQRYGDLVKTHVRGLEFLLY